jgi:hypothetical protein
MASDEKACPHCAETVKAAALKCKHCGSELPPPPPTPADDAPEKTKVSCAQMLGCFGVLMVVGLISAIFNAGDSQSNNNIADIDNVQVNSAEEQASPREKRNEKSRPADVEAIRKPEIDAVAAATPSAQFRALCYVGPSAEKNPGVTLGEFIDRGKRKGYFRNTVITGGNGSYTLRFRSPQNNDLNIKIITIYFKQGDPTPGCKSTHSAVPTGGKVNFDHLNSGNFYALYSLFDGMAFGDEFESLPN